MPLFIETKYFQTAVDKLCSEYRKITVDDIKTCKEAAQELEKKFGGTAKEDNWPKGCYAYFDDIYFNQHSAGSSNNRARQICGFLGKRKRI